MGRKPMGNNGIQMPSRDRAVALAAGLPAGTRRRAAPGKARGNAKANDAGGDSASEGELSALIGYALRRAQLRVFDDFYETLSVEGITPARFSALAVIDANPRINQSVLAQTLDIARSGVVMLVDTLEALGLVSREPIEADKRAYALRLTKNGKTTLQRIRRQVAVHEARVCAHLKHAEKRALLELLSRVGAIR